MIVKVNVGGFKKEEISIIANSMNNEITLNDKKVNFDVGSFINEIQDIVKSWELEMINHRVLDGSWYSVKINDGINEKIFRGRNKYPKNYNRFLELVNIVKNIE